MNIHQQGGKGNNEPDGEERNANAPIADEGARRIMRAGPVRR